MIERTRWVSALKALPTNELLGLVEEISTGWKIQPKSVPQSGLGMLKLNDTAFDEPFYLGEFPVSMAWLEVTIPDGHTAEGAAQVMDDRVEVAEALALCDAVLSGHLPGHDRVLHMVEKGLLVREANNLERKRILAHTQVDFSLLDDVGDETGVTNAKA